MNLLKLFSGRRRWFLLAPVVFGLAVVLFAARYKVSPLGWGWFGAVNSSGETAIGGYDPVAYRSGYAQKGSADHSLTWRGAQWHFHSRANLEAFQRSPESMAPDFGGFCAFAAVKGFTADVDPEVFHLVDGRLYLFADEGVKENFIAEVRADQRLAAQQAWQDRLSL